jgi:hypothetical protein
MNSMLQRSLAAAAVLAVLLGASGTARAGMMVTPAGLAQGFVLTTFADGFPNGSSFGNPVGPVGIAVLGSGQVMVSSYTAGSNAVFATDTDGQHYSGAALSSSSFFAPSGLAISGGNIYQALQGPGTVVQVDSHGNFIQTIATGISFATGLVTNPTNGHLIVSDVIFSTVYDINPVTNAKSVFLSGVNFDGLAFSRDGSILLALSSASADTFWATTRRPRRWSLIPASSPARSTASPSAAAFWLTIFSSTPTTAGSSKST